jgi:hypothetical protein
VTFRRWVLGRGKDFSDDYITAHPLVCDRSIRWLVVDSSDKLTVGEEP